MYFFAVGGGGGGEGREGQKKFNVSTEMTIPNRKLPVGKCHFSGGIGFFCF